jgi:hypothetical protein
MSIRPFLLIKVSKYGNWSMESCSTFWRSGNPCSLTTRCYVVASMFFNCIILCKSMFLGCTQHQFMFSRLVLWVLARIYYSILTYILIIEVVVWSCATASHITIEVAAQSYATTFSLSAGLMQKQARIYYAYLSQMISLGVWHGHSLYLPRVFLTSHGSTD